MMFIIASKNPLEAVKYLVEHTNKNFIFKSLLEVLQLVCSAGISDVFKPLKQGRKIQKWVLKYKGWTLCFIMFLYRYCLNNIDISYKTAEKINKIISDLTESVKNEKSVLPTTAIFRYKKDYECEYESNSELPIDVAVEEYKKYLNWKFKGKFKICQNAEVL